VIRTSRERNADGELHNSARRVVSAPLFGCVIRRSWQAVAAHSSSCLATVAQKRIQETLNNSGGSLPCMGRSGNAAVAATDGNRSAFPERLTRPLEGFVTPFCRKARNRRARS